MPDDYFAQYQFQEIHPIKYDPQPCFLGRASAGIALNAALNILLPDSLEIVLVL